MKHTLYLLSTRIAVNPARTRLGLMALSLVLAFVFGHNSTLMNNLPPPLGTGGSGG